MKAVYDVDDLWSEQQITELLLPIKEAYPAFRVTAYAIPNRLGPVHDLKEKYPWICFGIHGWEHSFLECLSWTPEMAAGLIRDALDMGYARIFKAPNWAHDEDLEIALKELNVVLHRHIEKLPLTKGLIVYPPDERSFNIAHTHIVRSPVVDFIEENPLFQPEALSTVTEFGLAIDEARMYPEEMSQ